MNSAIQFIQPPVNEARDAKQEQIVQEISCIVAKVLINRDAINPSIAHYISVLIENLVVKK